MVPWIHQVNGANKGGDEPWLIFAIFGALSARPWSTGGPLTGKQSHYLAIDGKSRFPLKF